MAEGGKYNDDISKGSEELPETGSDAFSPGLSLHDVSDKLCPEELKQISEEYEEVLKNGGIEAFQKYIQNKLNAWKTTPVNIAVIGRSGVGKSTFINAIRNLKTDDEGAAGTDVVEATKSMKHYSFQSRSNIVLWDLPGVGTRTFKRESYEERVNTLLKEHNLNSLDGIAEFDFYLLLTADRFTEDDAWLAIKIENSYKKKYYLVRTKIAHNIRDEQTSRKNPRTKEEILDVISKDLIRNLEEEDIAGAAVFLIDSLSPLEFDFEKLKGQLIADAPISKIESVAYSLSCHSKHMIERKRKTLLGSHLTISAMSICTKFATYMIPFDLNDEFTDLLDREYRMYKRVFNLTDKDLKYATKTLGISVENLISKLELRSFEYDNSDKLWIEYKTNFGTDSEHGLKVWSIIGVLPIVGETPAIIYKGRKTYKFLKKIVNMCADDAIKIQDELCKLAESNAKRV